MAQKTDNIHKRRKSTIRKGYIFMLAVLLLMIGFLVRLVTIQNTNVKEIEDKYINKNYRVDTLKAVRGNLYAADGSILATTVMRYDVYLDFKTMTKRDTLYTNNIDALTDSLARQFGKPKHFYRKTFDEQKKKKNQYFRLAQGLDFDQFDRLRKFPIFNKGKNKGGFIVERKYKRELATSEIGAGTIGMDDHRGKSGLEYAFTESLSGTDGMRLVQRVSANQWKPIDYWKIKEPIDGNDVYTTLDLRIQDIAHTALEKQLREYEAKHGTVVVMEVETGKVRAMVNLTKNTKGEYEDINNHAIRGMYEPGSTFKVISLLAAMDDGYIDENTTVNTNPFKYAGVTLRDAHGGGVYEISDVLAKSSNVGTAKLITKFYGARPEVFFDHLRKWKMFEKLDLEIGGSIAPIIRTPKHKRWNKYDLASISYGYSTQFSILHLTTFYNAIANKGKMVTPLFIDKIMNNGQVIYEAKPKVLVNKIASDKAIQMMTSALTKAVEKGTARSIFTPNLKMAGKTGTARDERDGKLKYNASFAGFYPSDNPKYTCYVMVHAPNTSKGYYGGTVSAPVFKEIAGKTFLKTPQNIENQMLVDKKVDLSRYEHNRKKLSLKNEIMPEVKNLVGRDIIPQLENAGYRVEYKGVGKITSQLPLAGTKLKKNQRIYLTLQN